MDPARAIEYGDYFLTRKIATGGMAELFRARKVGAAGFEKLLVIKRLLPHLATDHELRDMFLDEARLASQLTHNNIAQVYDLGMVQSSDPSQPQSETTYFIAMEYVFGKSLAEIIRRGQECKGPLSVQNAVRVVASAAAGLEYAHQKKNSAGEPLGLVHRDVSPQNILISYEGEVKLVDFGIAKALSSSTTTRPGTLKGKFSYMAPEQAKGQEVDRRTDVYALGIVLWEALTATRLFSGESEAVILGMALNPQVTPPQEQNPQVPTELAEICMKALAPDPGDRYASAQEMNDALEGWLHSLATYPSTYSLRSHMNELFAPELETETSQIQDEQSAVRHAAEDGGTEEAAPTPPEDATQVYQTGTAGGGDEKAGGKGKLGLVLGLAAAVVVAGGVFFFMGGSQDTPPTTPVQKEEPAQTAQSQPATQPEPEPKDETPPPPLVVQGREALEAKRYDEALTLLDQAVAGSPDWSEKVSADRAAALLGLAAGKASTDPQAALKDLEMAAQADPGSGEVYLQLGRVRTKLKQYDQALAAYDQAMELDKETLDVAQFNRGFIFMQQKKYKLAEQAYRQVVGLDSPYEADAWVNLAVCDYHLGDLKAAEYDLQQALAENPNHAQAQKYLKLLKTKIAENAGSQAKE